MCDIYNCLKEMICFHSLWEWFSDILIPLAGAVAIPVMIWYFGSEKAEERKELKELKNNLNLLLAICFNTMNKLITLRQTIVINHIIEQDKNIDPFSKEALQLTSVYTLPTKMNVLNISNYSACIEYSENYVLMLLDAISAVNIINFKLERRNFYASLIDPREDLNKRILCFQTLVNYDLQEYEGFLKYIDGDILLIRDFIKQTKDLEKKIKGLKLDNITYSEEQLALFMELEKAQTKENKNDQ